MKKFFTILLSLLPLFTFSQITITAADGPAVGDTVPRAVDDAVVITQGSAGANQTWDFSSVTQTSSYSTKIMTPGSTPYGGSFGSSNMAMTNDNQTYIFFNKTASELITTGAAGDLIGSGTNITSNFNPDLTIVTYPVNYLDAYTDNYAFDVTTDGSAFSVDEIRLKHEGTTTDTVDGWGTLITPLGSYEVLRNKHIEYAKDSIWFTLCPIPLLCPWTLLGEFLDTTVSYSYVALETGIAMAELALDSMGNPEEFTWNLIPPAPLANFSWADTGSGSLNFTDMSTNSPATWAWDFGDGNNSNMQNSNNIYSGNGKWNVCLTVTNVIGMDTYCDSVTVVTFVGIDDPIYDHKGLTVFPNPSSGKINFLPNMDLHGSYNLKLMDLSGKFILEEKLQLDQHVVSEVDLNYLPKGMYYFLLVDEAGGQNFAGKISLR